MMVTETTITGFSLFDPKGKPEFVRARKALQYASSIDDYVQIMLDGNNGGYANDWLLGDNKTGEIARFELGLKMHRVWRTKDGYFVGSNFPSDPELIKKETDFNPNEHGQLDERAARALGAADANQQRTDRRRAWRRSFSPTTGTATRRRKTATNARCAGTWPTRRAACPSGTIRLTIPTAR